LGKAGDALGVTAELVLAACSVPGCEFLKLLHKIVLNSWNHGVAGSFKRAVMVAIWKRKGDSAEMTNFRGITLLPYVRRIVAWLAIEKPREYLSELLHQAQYGGASTC
jgi:hypothetical protein